MTLQKDSSQKNRFTPVNPEKYLGDPSKIIFRSSWEKHAFVFLDGNPYVTAWASEEVAIRYMKPQPDGSYKPANYYPDLFVEYHRGDHVLIRELIEIKPKSQTKKTRARKLTRRLYEDYTLAVNMCKWEAAEEWCKQRGIVFKICTEDELFGNKKHKR